jgi:hypothetical protein
MGYRAPPIGTSGKSVRRIPCKHTDVVLYRSNAGRGLG